MKIPVPSNTAHGSVQVKIPVPSNTSSCVQGYTFTAKKKNIRHVVFGEKKLGECIGTKTVFMP